jgi:hypothetical protein
MFKIDFDASLVRPNGAEIGTHRTNGKAWLYRIAAAQHSTRAAGSGRSLHRAPMSALRTFRTFAAAAPNSACGALQHIHILGNSCGRIKEALEKF